MTSKAFLKHVLLIILFNLVLLFLVFWGLRIYTNHGQQLELPNYVDQHVDDATRDALKRSFKIVVNDSSFHVGKSGGLILDQNPKPGSKVKERRKIYVTITKSTPDRKPLSSLPQLYGRDFDRKRKELEIQGFQCRIKDYVYDPGEPNHILQVWYNGRQIVGAEGVQSDAEIEVGGTLEFTLSKRFGGDTTIPDLICRSVSEARFILLNSNLKLGEIREVGPITDPESAWIRAQSPTPGDGAIIQMGESIDVSIVQEKPEACQ